MSRNSSAGAGARQQPGEGGLRGHDKQQPDLQPPDAKSGSQPLNEPPEQPHTPHQAGQHGADVRGNPPMHQPADSLPEGLTRERKGPYDKNVGRNEPASQVPHNWNQKAGR